MIKLGIMAPFGDGLNTSGEVLRDVASISEDSGVESVWTVEHVVVANQYERRYPYSADGRMPGSSAETPMPDPLDTIAFMAGASRTLKFGTAMVVAKLRFAGYEPQSKVLRRLPRRRNRLFRQPRRNS